MIHNKLLEALSYLECWDITKLKDEYEKEREKEANGKNKADSVEDNKELLSFLQKITIKRQCNTDTITVEKKSYLDLLIEEIDKKIAELEREEQKKQGNQETKNETLNQLNEIKPMFFSSALYKFNYVKTLIYNCLINNEVQLNIIDFIKELDEDREEMDIIDLFYKKISKLINGDYTQEDNKLIIEKMQALTIIRRRIKSELRIFANRFQCTFVEQNYIKIYMEILFIILSIETDKNEHEDDDENEKKENEAKSYIYYYLADAIYGHDTPDYVNGVKFALGGLNLTNDFERCDAYNTLGYFAASTPMFKQLAYDAYYSWIMKKPMGVIGKYLPQNYKFPKDDSWRDEKKEKVALMYANFAYVCGVISNTYELFSERAKIFNDLAIKYIKKAINISKKNSYYCTYGTLLSDYSLALRSSLESKKIYKKSRKAYKKYMELTDDKDSSNMATALRSVCETIFDELLIDLVDVYNENMFNITFDSWFANDYIHNKLKKTIKLIKKYICEVNKLSDVHNDENNFYIWEEYNRIYIKLKDRHKYLAYEMLIIGQLSRKLRFLLERNEYSSVNYFTRKNEIDRGIKYEREGVKPIAYYTTLQNATNLFDVMCRHDNHTSPYVVKEFDGEYKEGINCITMMDAHYMNDTYEGMALADAVEKRYPGRDWLFYDGDITQFREHIYKNNYVFLKSFTDRKDDLLMWNRYGSDRHLASKDSNGCYIQFNTDFFDRANGEGKDVYYKLMDKTDDYALYRVVYISEDGFINDDKNPGLPQQFKMYYELLIKLLSEINEQLGMLNDNNILKLCREFLQNVLGKIIFLFKSDSYADESEYRLIVIRESEDVNGIRFVSDEPQMLCINPYFQIDIEEVILGPNAEKKEYWTAYLSYQIKKMKQHISDMFGEEKIKGYEIKQSKIHYHID